MICSICNGVVKWECDRHGNWTHTECESCGGTNCQVPEDEIYDNDDDDDLPNAQANGR